MPLLSTLFFEFGTQEVGRFRLNAAACVKRACRRPELTVLRVVNSSIVSASKPCCLDGGWSAPVSTETPASNGKAAAIGAEAM